MQKRVLLSLSIFTFFFGLLANAESSNSSALAAHLKKTLASSGFKESELGVWVGRQNNSNLEKIFGQGDNKIMIPASLSKLITEGAILHFMHPSYKFRTALLAAASVKSGALAGDIYLKGGGDPSFVSENMWVLVNNFTRNGITSIEGDLVVDDSRFDAVRFSEERETTRVDRAYDAPVGAMSMNWNSVNVYVRPGASSGEPCVVTADPVNTYIRIKNDCRTGGSGKNISVERKSEKEFWGDVIEVQGKMSANQEEAVVYKSISQPDLWSGANLLEFLKQRGISVKGKVKKGVAPAGAHELAFVESKPLSEILGDMAKFSNNYVAEMLVKNLAAENGTQPATMSAGLAQVQKFLDKNGFSRDDIQFTNASGFTRNNKFKVSELGRYLNLICKDFTTFPEFVMALPIAGIDGTLKSRMKDTPAQRWVRAKTGLLDGVAGLAGYAGQADGELLEFVFIFNGNKNKEASARALFDRLAALLVQAKD